MVEQKVERFNSLEWWRCKWQQSTAWNYGTGKWSIQQLGMEDGKWRFNCLESGEASGPLQRLEWEAMGPFQAWNFGNASGDKAQLGMMQ